MNKAEAAARAALHAKAEAEGVPITLNFEHCQACGAKLSTEWAFCDENDGYTPCCNERAVGAGYCDSTCYHFGVDPIDKKNKALPVHDAGPYREPATGRVMTSHSGCSHEKTKAARAACRKARQKNSV